jgi:hypothetical protein
MQELSLVINNPGEGHWLQHIDWNKEEFEAAIEAAVKDYTDLAYTDDQIKEAKADRAELNKLKKAIDERRKAVKKAISAPYDEFEKEVKEVTQKLDAAVGQIDSQVKAYEEKQKAEKKAAIEECFRSKVGSLEETVTINRVFDPKWLNATVTMKSIETEMTARLTNIKNGYDFCMNLPEEEKTIAVMAFEKNFDLGYAIGEVNLYKQRKAAEEAAKEEARRHEENQQRLEKIIGDTGVHDALADNVAAVEILEEPAEEERAEDPEGEKVVKTLTIPFNGKNLDYILAAIRVATMPKRGTIRVQFQGTEREHDQVQEELTNKGIGFKVEE